jgi:hypothetical protein
VGTDAEQDLGNVGGNELANGIEILSREGRETSAEVTGLWRGCGWRVAAGCVEKDDRGVRQDGWEVDLFEHLA